MDSEFSRIQGALNRVQQEFPGVNNMLESAKTLAVEAGNLLGNIGDTAPIAFRTAARSCDEAANQIYQAQNLLPEIVDKVADHAVKIGGTAVSAMEPLTGALPGASAPKITSRGTDAHTSAAPKPRGEPAPYLPPNTREITGRLLRRLQELFPGTDFEAQLITDPTLLTAAALAIEGAGFEIHTDRLANEELVAEAQADNVRWKQDRQVWQPAPHLRDPLTAGIGPFGAHDKESIAALRAAGTRADPEFQPLDKTVVKLTNRLLRRRPQDLGEVLNAEQDAIGLNSVQLRAFLERLIADYAEKRKGMSPADDLRTTQTIQVIRSTIAGESGREIAARLGLEPGKSMSRVWGYKTEFENTVRPNEEAAMLHRVLFLGCVDEERRRALWYDSYGYFSGHLLHKYASKKSAEKPAAD